jgi:hypothetical protein
MAGPSVESDLSGLSAQAVGASDAQPEGGFGAWSRPSVWAIIAAFRSSPPLSPIPRSPEV